MIRILSFVVGVLVGVDGIAQTVQILGGRETTEDWSWMARIIDGSQENTLDPDAFICGATLIHPYWAVTAAHCVFDASASDLHVVLGAQSSDLPDRMRRIAVAEIHPYPGFAPVSLALEHDIALLLLAEPAEGFDTISLVSDGNLTTPGIQAKAIGWGSQGGTTASELSVTLQEADLPLVSLELANQRRSYDGELTSNMLPAGYPKGRVDSCQGDSGGPLMVPDETGSGWELAGVTSFGDGCGDPFKYGIYTRITSYRSWIMDYVHPDYGAWERANDVHGERQDPDNDGWNNIAEYVSNSDPLDPASTGEPMLLSPGGVSPARPVLEFLRRASATSLDFRFSYSTDLRSWLPMDPNELTWEEAVLNEGTIQSRVHMPSVTGGLQKVFIRRDTSFTKALEPFTVPITLGRAFEGNLTTSFSIRSGGPGSGRFRDFALSISEKNVGAIFHLESEAFPPRLELWDRKTMELVAQDDNVEELPTARIQSPQIKGGEYILRIGSGDSEGRGEFVIRSTVLPSDTIHPGDTIIRTLKDTALSHFTSLGRALPVDAFLLAGTMENEFIQLSVESTEFPPAIDLISAETGETLDFSADFSFFEEDDFEASIGSPDLEPEASYIVLISSSEESQFGSYTLKVQREEITDPAERPSLVIGPESTLTGTIARGDPSRPVFFEIEYTGNIVALTGLQPNREVTIDLESENFDPYLLVIDNETGETAFENDDFMDSLNSQIIFTLPEDREVADYSLFVTSSFGDGFGGYTLTVSSERVPVPVDSTITPIELGNSIEGELASDDATRLNEFGLERQGDHYDLINIEPGQRVIIDLESSAFDSLLWLLDGETDSIVRQDDDSGEGLDSQIIFDIPEDSDGTGFRLFVTSASSTALGGYRLSVKEGGRPDPNDTLVPKVTSGESVGGALTSTGASREGEFGSSYFGDYFELVGLESQHWINLRLSSEAFDTNLWLIDTKDDTVIMENDDFGFGLDSQIRFFLPENRDDADYRVFVTSSFGDEFGDYVLSVESRPVEILLIGSQVESSIGRDDQRDPAFLVFEGTYFMEEFALGSMEPGTDIHLHMSSDQFAAEVYVINAVTAQTVAWSRETTRPEATLSFTTEPDTSYLIRATTKFERRSGKYRLEVTSNLATEHQ